MSVKFSNLKARDFLGSATNLTSTSGSVHPFLNQWFPFCDWCFQIMLLVHWYMPTHDATQTPDPPASLYLLICNKQRICSLFLHKSSCVRCAAIVPEIVVVVLLSIRLSGLWIISQFLQKQKAQQCLKAPAPLHPHPQFKHQAGSSVLLFFFFSKRENLEKRHENPNSFPRERTRRIRRRSQIPYTDTHRCAHACANTAVPPFRRVAFFIIIIKSHSPYDSQCVRAGVGGRPTILCT